MKFGPIAIADAVGCIAAHTIRAGATTVKKGAPITGEIAARLAEEGVREIVAVRLEQETSPRTRPPPGWRRA